MVQSRCDGDGGEASSALPIFRATQQPPAVCPLRCGVSTIAIEESGPPVSSIHPSLRVDDMMVMIRFWVAGLWVGGERDTHLPLLYNRLDAALCTPPHNR